MKHQAYQEHQLHQSCEWCDPPLPALLHSLSFTLLRSILSAAFGVNLRGLVCVCGYTRVHVHMCAEEGISTIAAASSNQVNLRSGTFSFPTSQIRGRALHLPSLLSFSSLSILFRMPSTSVPVLVFVVPAVEVYVERHDAARRHAGDQSPAGGAHTQRHLCKPNYSHKI